MKEDYMFDKHQDLIMKVRLEVKNPDCETAKYCSVSHNIRELLNEYDKTIQGDKQK